MDLEVFAPVGALSKVVSPRRFNSGGHLRNAVLWGPTPLQPFANARLLLGENAIPGDTTSAVVASHVLECFLERSRYITARDNGPGVDTGDFTFQGMICRAAIIGEPRLRPCCSRIWSS